MREPQLLKARFGCRALQQASAINLDSAEPVAHIQIPCQGRHLLIILSLLYTARDAESARGSCPGPLARLASFHRRHSRAN